VSVLAAHGLRSPVAMEHREHTPRRSTAGLLLILACLAAAILLGRPAESEELARAEVTLLPS